MAGEMHKISIFCSINKEKDQAAKGKSNQAQRQNLIAFNLKSNFEDDGWPRPSRFNQFKGHSNLRRKGRTTNLKGSCLSKYACTEQKYSLIIDSILDKISKMSLSYFILWNMSSKGLSNISK